MKRTKENEALNITDEQENLWMEEAHELTDENRATAEANRRDDWLQTARAHLPPSLDIKSAKAEEALFQDILDFLDMRTQQMERGTYVEVAYVAATFLPIVLAFDFSFCYECMTWDPEASSAEKPEFAVEYVDVGTLPEQAWKDGIVRQFEAFLMAGAAQARKVGSDAYEKWRAALVAFTYKHRRFAYGRVVEEVDRLWESVREAAQLTAIDVRIAAKIDLSAGTPPRARACKKNAKNVQK